MAGNTVNIKLQLTSEGMDSAQKQAEAINSNLQSASAAAKALGRGLGTGGGTAAPAEPPAGGSTSSRRVARSAPSPTVVAATRASEPIGGGDVEMYNRARGASGAAGGTARDFADQARGLGGLVRLYATFAANIFAVSAAFNALSRAMDTTNMVKGLDQLGATSGRSLGSLSKRLVEATDGAVSLREAMESTAKASSAGLNNQQILRLGEAAKKASLALGVDMSDALNRLTRGISKIEPELLDELGIYVKIDVAAQNYARTLGKTATNLTEFERRQAFALETLKQVEEKFGSIKIDSNPYNRLLATLKNVAQTGLEVINTFLTPVVKLLAESPTALAGILTVIGITLLKQVIPALGEWRQGLRKTADDAAKTAENIKNSFGDEFQDRLEARFKIPDLQKSLEATENEINKFQKKQLAAIPAELPKSLSKLTSLSSIEADQKGIDTLKKYISTRQEWVDTGMSGTKKLSKAQVEAEREGLDYLNKKLALLQRQYQLNELLAKQAKEKARLDAAFGQAQILADQPPGRLDPETIAAIQYEKAIKKRDQYSAISNAAENARIVGVRQSWVLLNQEIADKGIKGLTKYSTMAQGLFSAVGTRIFGLINSFSMWGFVIAGLAGAFEFLNSWLTNNAKETQETTKSFELLKETGDSFDRTLANIASKDPLRQFSTESIKARATAFNELASSIQDSFKKIEQQTKSANWWDEFIDGFKTVVGKDLLSVSAKNLSQQIVKAVRGAGEESGAIIRNITALTGVSATDDIALEGVLGKNPETFFKLLPLIQAELEKTQKKLSQTAGASEQLDESFKQASKTFDDILIAAIPTDPIAKLGNESLRVGTAMKEAFKNGSVELSQFASIVGDITKLRFFSPETAEFFLAQAKDVKQLTGNLQSYNVLLQQNTAEQQQARDILRDMSRSTDEMLVARRKLNQLQAARPAIEQAQKRDQAALEPLLAQFRKATNEAFLNGGKLLSDSIDMGFKKAALTIRSAYAGRLEGTSAGIEEQAKIKQEEIKLQLRQIDVQLGLIEVMENLRITQEKILLQDIKKEQLAKGDFQGAQKTEEIIAAVEQGRSRYSLRNRSGAEMARQDLASGSEAQQYAARGAQGALMSARAAAAQRAQTASQSVSVEVERQNKQLDLQNEKLKDVANLKLLQLSGDKKMLDYQLGQQVYLTEQEMSMQRILDRQILTKQQEVARLDILNQIEKLKKTEADEKAPEESRTRATQARRELEEKLGRLGEKQAEERAQQDDDFVLKRLENTRKIFDFEQKEIKRNFDLQEQLSLAQREARKTDIDLGVKTGLYDEITAGRLSADLQADEERAASKKRLFDLEQQQALANYEFGKQLSAAQTQEQINNILNNLAVSNLYYGQVRANEEYITGLKLQNINKTTELNEKLSLTAGLASTLGLAFGEVGTALGSVVEALVKSTIKTEEYAKKQKELQSIIGDKEAPEDLRIQKQKELDDLNKQNVKNELTGYAQIAGSAKKLFKEKTVAYKALAAVEKAMHIAKLAMEAKELLVKLGFIKTGVAAKVVGETQETTIAQGGALSRVPTYIGEIYGKTIGQLGPIAGPVVAAALAAFVVSLLGGSSKSPPGGFTAEEQQKVQGTGQYYDSSGRLQSTGGGALGDATQKSKSIENAISNMEKYDFKNLQYSNKMLKALYDIRENTKNFATSIIKALPGINLGPTSATSGNWLFGKTTTTTLDRGLQVVGTIGQIIDKTAKIFEYTNTQYKSSGFLGLFGGGTSYGTERTQVEDAELSRNLSMIFSSMADALGGAAETLGIGSTEAILQQFRNIDLSQEFGRISLMNLKPDEMADALNSVISAALDSATAEMFPYLVKFQELGETMGDTILRLANDFSVVNLSLKELGLTLPILAEEGTTATAAQLQRVKDAEDRVAAATAADNAMYESRSYDYISDTETITLVKGTAQTAQDLADANRELAAAQKEVADANAGVTTRNIELVQSLIDAAGGLENFVEQNRFFAENFLTETERLVPVQASLTAELDRLGLSSVDTVEEFKALVLGIDFTTDAGRALYQSLMDIAPAFSAVYGSTSKVLDQKEFEQKLYDQETRILELLNKDQELLNRRRAKEIEELSKYSDAQSAVLVANQQYIYALEDENKIRDQLIKQRDKEKKALEDTIKTLKTAIETLQNYKKSLLTGDLTTLTPMQQYAQNKSDFDAISAILASSTSTAEEKATAAGRLPQVADKLLTSARTLFASGSEYQAIFDTVMGVIDSSTATLEAQKSDAEKQLEALTSMTAFLDSTEENTKTTAELVRDLKEANAKSELARQNAIDTAEEWQVDVLDALGLTRDTDIDYDLLAAALTTSITTALVGDTGTTGAVDTTSGGTAGSVQGVLSANQGYLESQLEELRAIKSNSDLIHTCLQTVETILNTSETSRKTEYTETVAFRQLFAQNVDTDLNGIFEVLMSLNNSLTLKAVEETKEANIPEPITQPTVVAVDTTPISTEIRKLTVAIGEVKTELVTIKEDQVAQTKAIVYTTYDASTKNAEAVSATITDTISFNTFQKETVENTVR